jgi:hypothetical protein
MNTDQYDMWIKNHQSPKADFDITDAVMNRIAQNIGKESISDKVRNRFLMNLHQAKASVRTCVLVSGALAGALRMLFVVYYALFT